MRLPSRTESLEFMTKTLFGFAKISPKPEFFTDAQDDAALKQHHAKPYTKAVMENYDHWLAQPLRFDIMAKLR